MTTLSLPRTPQDASAVPPRLRVAQLRTWVRRSRPSLDPESSTFRAAIFLLAACYVGRSIDRLVRLTRCDREFGARCARRLYDNGVWGAEGTVSSWVEDRGDEASFWADVAVAEGKLWRRVEENGNIEWAPAGSWMKAFTVSDLEEAAPCEVVYLSFPQADPERAAWDGGIGPSECGMPLEPPVELREPEFSGRERFIGRVPEKEHPASGAAAGMKGTALFPDAIWLT